jgi:predicted O-methyltransferase YrrM
VIRRARKWLVRRLAGSKLGERALTSIGLNEPKVLIEALGPRVNRGARFSTVRGWPQELRAFEDLAFLFSSHQLHHAIISMAVDEAAYLYRVAQGLQEATVVEIGRSKGGSTLLLAASLDEKSHVWSYDLHVKRTAGVASDDELRAALARFGLAERVTIVVADSRTAEPPPRPCDLVLVDGDHSYEGVRADFEAWHDRVSVGGHMLFHDAVSHGDLNVPHESVARFVRELERDGRGYARRGEAGTLVDFVRVSG